MKKHKGPDDSSTESAEAADSDPQELAGFLDDSATWGWRIIENRVPCREWMDLPRDGPDRPACIIMWYSAPVAEELCEGYKGVQRARVRRALSKQLRWDSPISGRMQGKKLVECSNCDNFTRERERERERESQKRVSSNMATACLTQAHGAHQG